MTGRNADHVAMTGRNADHVAMIGRNAYHVAMIGRNADHVAKLGPLGDPAPLERLQTFTAYYYAAFCTLKFSTRKKAGWQPSQAGSI